MHARLSVQVQLMCRYLKPSGQFKGIMEVPDPYYGGAKGFELVGVPRNLIFRQILALRPALKSQQQDLQSAAWFSG